MSRRFTGVPRRTRMAVAVGLALATASLLASAQQSPTTPQPFVSATLLGRGALLGSAIPARPGDLLNLRDIERAWRTSSVRRWPRPTSRSNPRRPRTPGVAGLNQDHVYAGQLEKAAN